MYVISSNSCNSLQSRFDYYFYFKDKKADSERGLACWRSDRQKVMNQGFELTSLTAEFLFPVTSLQWAQGQGWDLGISAPEEHLCQGSCPRSLSQALGSQPSPSLSHPVPLLTPHSRPLSTVPVVLSLPVLAPPPLGLDTRVTALPKTLHWPQ